VTTDRLSSQIVFRLRNAIVTAKKCERPSGKSCTDAFGTVHIRLEKMAAFHSENESNVWKNNNQQSIWNCVKGQLGQGDHMVIMTKSFSKSFVSRKGFPPTLKRKVGVFKFPVWLAFSKKFRFRGRLVWTVGLIIEIKLCLQFISAVVWTEPSWNSHKRPVNQWRKHDPFSKQVPVTPFITLTVQSLLFWIHYLGQNSQIIEITDFRDFTTVFGLFRASRGLFSHSGSK